MKVCGSTVKLQLKLVVLSARRDVGIHGVAVKCLDIMKNTDYDKLSDNAKDYSESNLVSIRSLMDAFGITDIKTAVLDFWWNFHGDSKHSDAGFWF